MRIIAGEWGGRRLRAPRGRDVRPTSDRVREAWMSALGPRIPDAKVLDLFAGSGALGLETLSRGAREVAFVEAARGALAALDRNIETLGAEARCRVHRGDVFAYLDRLPSLSFHLALADPPYDQGHAARLLERFHAEPFALELWVEHRTGEDLPTLDALRQRRYGDTTLTILEAPE